MPSMGTCFTITRSMGLCSCLAWGHTAQSQDQGPLPLPSIGPHFTIKRQRVFALACHWGVPHYCKFNRRSQRPALDRTLLSQGQGSLHLPNIEHGVILHHHLIERPFACLALDRASLPQDQRPLPWPSIASYFTITRSRAPALA